MTADADELRRQLASATTDMQEHAAGAAAEAEHARVARAAAEGHQTDHRDAEKRWEKLDEEIRRAEPSLAVNQSQLDARTESLAAGWHAGLPALTAARVEKLDAERAALDESGVAGLVAQLDRDAARRDEWETQLRDTEEQLEHIPEDARYAPEEAERVAEAAARAAHAAEQERDRARDDLAELNRRAEDCAKRDGQIAATERDADLHQLLDALLGKEGLRRELVRSAEREIVTLANDTVQKLSDGDLAIELEEADGGADEAFALRVRRADGPEPIPVDYVSGSQKFRVAISAALAIGRYAAGPARPLESVIIDEGFGSLDKDGLRAAADELNRLRLHLRRIILVSHQDEFADRFPVVIQLRPRAEGTVAEAVRR